MPTIAAPSVNPRRREPVAIDSTTISPPSPARELARRALDVLRRARRASPPERWQQPTFGREVDLVRLDLMPIRTRAALASSFGREAFNIAVDDDWRAQPVTSLDAGRQIGPVLVAYAIRWLELGDGRRRAGFREWLDNPAEQSLR